MSGTVHGVQSKSQLGLFMSSYSPKPANHSAVLKVLFLSGGLSQRMGRDKTMLDYSGQTEVQRWWQIFDRLELAYLWSIRPNQYDASLWPAVPRLLDLEPGQGPMAVLLAAHQLQPDLAWLLIACDWPLLGQSQVQQLIDARDSIYLAT
ncbi:MAG: NTP transferase domain-containing protein, partial [Proteobacteria bacterium]|nr:NTP transferase domain-containing protein [Pseudomonadota bacterium]